MHEGAVSGGRRQVDDVPADGGGCARCRLLTRPSGRLRALSHRPPEGAPTWGVLISVILRYLELLVHSAKSQVSMLDAEDPDMLPVASELSCGCYRSALTWVLSASIASLPGDH